MSLSKSGTRHTIAAGSREKRGTARANRVTNSIASQLRGSINLLIKRLEDTRPHFIRCIKPNAERSPTLFDPKMVLHQMKCLGVLEAIRAQQTGYPVRLSHRNFAERYRICGLSASAGTSTKASLMLEAGKYVEACNFLLDGGLREINGGALNDVFVGKTMVLYRPVHRDILETLRRRGQRRVVVILQCVVRLHSAAKKVKKLRIKNELKAVLSDFSQNDVNLERLRSILKKASSIEGMSARPWSELVEAREMLRLLERRRTVVGMLRKQLELWGIDPFTFQSLSERLRLERGKTNPSDAGLLSNPQSDKFIDKLEQSLEDAALVDIGGGVSTGSVANVGDEHTNLMDAAKVCTALLVSVYD